MAFDLTQLLSSTSFTIFTQEILLMMLVFLVDEIKRAMERRNRSIPDSFIHGMKSLLLAVMPAVALFHAFIESQLEIFNAIIVFVTVFSLVYVYLRLKYEHIPHIVSLVFGGIIFFLIVLFSLTYSWFK